MKTSERTDALGTKLIFTGVLEDSTFKAPFVSHRISYPLIRNSVYKFNSGYVHDSSYTWSVSMLASVIAIAVINP